MQMFPNHDKYPTCKKIVISLFDQHRRYQIIIMSLLN